MSEVINSIKQIIPGIDEQYRYSVDYRPITEKDINNLYEHNEKTTEYKRYYIVKRLLKLGYPCKSIDEFNYMLPDSCVDYTYKRLKCK